MGLSFIYFKKMPHMPKHILLKITKYILSSLKDTSIFHKKKYRFKKIT